MRPSNVVIRVVIGIMGLIAAIVVGGLILEVIDGNDLDENGVENEVIE